MPKVTTLVAMRPGLALRLFWCLVLSLLVCAVPARASDQSAQDQPAHALYDSFNALRLDPAAVYTISPADRIEIRRGDAVISLEEGKLAFFLPLEARVTGAAFSGRGHILALPRDPVEKQQMAYFLGAPVLDQEFHSAYLRFNDDTSANLIRQFDSAKLAPQTDAAFTSRWESALAQLNPSHSLRLLFGRLASDTRPYFYASLEGVTTGPFDVLLDEQRDENFLLGQMHKSFVKSFYDVWTSHKMFGTAPVPVNFHALHYSIETNILFNTSLDATASLRIRAETGSDRVLCFQLSRALAIDSVTSEKNVPLEFFQNEGMSLKERSARGNDFLYVVLPEAPARDQEFTLRFHYRGNVIEDAGNGVLFVGARESWYPHLGDASDFSDYDLTIRWPRRLRLVATGAKLDEREEGDSRVGHWKTERPIAVVGFNLGEYASASFPSSSHSVDVYANRQLEQSIQSRLSTLSSSEIQQTPHGVARNFPPSNRLELPSLQPSPADSLKRLGKEIDSSIRFYENYGGPFPFHTLSVSQIPGTFAQGWPGLLYLSTLSFLPSDSQERAGLSTKNREHFREIVPYHEVAHQWWGNVVAWSSYRDQWIDESIASYLAVLFADSQKNPEHTLRLWLGRFRERLLEKSESTQESPVDVGALTLGSRLDSSKSPEAYEQIIYNKGPWIFHMLREMLRQSGAKNPDARFAALLQTITSKYAGRAFSTDDLRREVEAVMTPAMDLEGGHSMEWFFEEWVRGTGIPHYRVEFTTHHTDKGLVVRGKLYQTGVPRSFIASVPLYASGPAGHATHLVTIVAAGPETSFSFVAAEAPHKILIDPQMTLLCVAE
jgi:Peptidase family M1 domain